MGKLYEAPVVAPRPFVKRIRMSIIYKYVSMTIARTTTL
jgi:hypothetical protein